MTELITTKSLNSHCRKWWSLWKARTTPLSNNLDHDEREINNRIVINKPGPDQLFNQRRDKSVKFSLEVWWQSEYNFHDLKLIRSHFRSFHFYQMGVNIDCLCTWPLNCWLFSFKNVYSQIEPKSIKCNLAVQGLYRAWLWFLHWFNWSRHF